MSFRTRHKTASGKSVYVIRGKDGKIKDVQDINRCIRQDKARTSVNVPRKKRQGHLGNYNQSGIVLRAIKSKKLI